MQRSLPSVASLAHTTSRTTRTETPARAASLLQDYTTPNTTRRPTQHDAQHNTTPNTPAALNGTHALRRTSADNPRFPSARPPASPVHTSTATTSAYDGPNSPHTASPNDHCLSIPDLVMVLRGCFGFGGSVQSSSRGHASRTLSCTSNPQTRRCVAYATAGTLLIPLVHDTHTHSLTHTRTTHAAHTTPRQYSQ
jgi:hypothetical protein